MDQITALSAKVEGYVAELDRVTRSWQSWLIEIESQAMMAPKMSESNLEGPGNRILKELGDLVVRRASLLDDFHRAGRSIPTLQAAARTLPLWSNRSFRSVFDSAKTRLSQLQRSQVATWVLLKHSADYCHDSLMLMMSGKTREDFTIGEQPPDPSGHLLDASL